jgi:LmbE family N-acetylglucosaminyl deacetylase
MSHPDFPKCTALVVAHPDDEALWATSVLSRVERIVFCFGLIASRPDWSEGRRRCLSDYPLPTVTNLGLQESEVFDGALWPDPVETKYGLAVRRRRGAMPAFSDKCYRENYTRLVRELRTVLTGYSSVITHNPWGEYGHEEHVQVFRAVAELQNELGFALWVSGYVSDKSYALMLRNWPMLDPSFQVFPTDPDLGARLKALYAQHDCWTWFRDYVWPAHEYFYRWIGSAESPTPIRRASLMEVNLLYLKWVPAREKALLNRLQQRVKRLLGT